jgi:PST family polysaccharide transporter
MLEHEPERTQDLTRLVVRGAGLASVMQLLSQLLGLVLYMIMARLTTPAVFGTFAAAAVLVTFTGIFAESGMQAAIIHRRDEVQAAASTAVVGTFVGGAALTLLALVTAPLVGLYFHDSQIGVVAVSLAGLLFLNAVPLVPAAMMSRRFQTVRRTILEPISIGTYGLVTAIALAAGMGIWGFVVGSYAGAVVRAAFTWGLARWRPSFRLVSYAMWRELARYGRHVVASEFLREVSSIANVALVGRYIGTAPLGQFRAASRVGTQLTTPIVAASGTMLLPAFARISADDDRLRSAAMRALRIQAIPLIPLSLAVIPLGRQVSIVLLGHQWQQAGVILGALFATTAVLPLVQIASEVFKSVGQPAFLARQWMLGGTLNIAATLAFVPLGVVWVGAGLSFAAAVVGGYAAWALARLLRMRARDVLFELAHPAVAGMLMLGALFAVRSALPQDDAVFEQLGVLVFEALIGAAVYLLALAVIRPASLREFLALAGHWRRPVRGQAATRPPMPE